MDRYNKAVSRDDLSQWLVHLCKPTFLNGSVYQPFDVLRNIIFEAKIRASFVKSIVQYEPLGASCFYDVPPQNWIELIETNPNGRRGFGLIVYKKYFWLLWGRPVIYTDNTTPESWDHTERYRLVYTNLTREKPADWTHEREWRVKGDFVFGQYNFPDNWWWPCVETIKEAQLILREFPGINQIYILELHKVITRADIII